MERKAALIELRDKVKAGEWATHRIAGLKKAGLSCQASYFLHSYHGSLDAAKSLHEAVFTHGEWAIIDTDGFAFVYDKDGGPDHSTHIGYGYIKGTPARAWLLAILEALISHADT